MGFKLPGKSIQTGTSAHSSALKMVTEQRAASALKARQETESPVKASEFGAEYRKNRDAGAKYFTYKGKEYTTESRSEKAARQKRGTSYADENPKKKLEAETTTTKTATSSGETEPDTTPEPTTVKKEKQDVKEVRKSGRESVKDAKRQKRIDILKAKKDVSDVKGKTKRSERLARKIERKEGTKTRKEQRQERRSERKDKRMAKKGYVRKGSEGSTATRKTSGVDEGGTVTKKEQTKITGSLMSDYKKPETKITGSLTSSSPATKKKKKQKTTTTKGGGGTATVSNY